MRSAQAEGKQVGFKMGKREYSALARQRLKALQQKMNYKMAYQEEIRKELNVVLVDRIEQVLEAALLDDACPADGGQEVAGES